MEKYNSVMLGVKHLYRFFFFSSRNPHDNIIYDLLTDAFVQKTCALDNSILLFNKHFDTDSLFSH